MKGAAPATGALLALLLASSRLAAPAQPSSRPPAPTPAPAPQAQAGTAPPGAATAIAGSAGVSVSISGGLEASIAHLPGRLIASAVARNPAGRYGLALLVAERGPAIAAPGAPGKTRWAPGPISLLFLEPGAREMETIASHLPEKVNAVAALSLLPSSGKEHGDLLLLSEPGIIYGLDPPWGGGAPAATGTHQLLAAPGLDLHSVHEDRSGLPRPRLPWVPVARAGQLQLLAAADREGEGGRRELRQAASFPLPVAAKREPWGLKLSSEPVHLLPGTLPAGAPRFAFGPESQGKRRLRTLLFAPEAGASPVEAWSLLPADEQDVDGTYETLNGRPILLVTSIPKIGILVKRDLRLFQLARDRSRGGNAPAFAVHTDCAIWHHLDAWFVDADGSGHQDLVLVYPEGLRGKKLRFLVYAAVGADRLAAQPRETTLDVNAQAWFYGGDFSGDGIPDLMVRSGRRLLLYPGIAKTDRLADHPAWSFDLPAKRSERPAKGSSSGGQHGDRGSRSDGDNDDNEAAGDEDGGRASSDRTARTLHLAQLVDLRGDGRATLVLSLDDGQGGTDLVAVQRAH